MDLNFLDFEQPIAELEAKIEELTRVSAESELDLSEEIQTLRIKCRALTEHIFSTLSAWQITQLARHPQRPYTADYLEQVVTDFQELHGDRMFADDAAIVAGVGYIGSHRVALIGHQKGRDTQEKVKRNFGMPRPEGYRKAQRIMDMAEKFSMPLVTFIDTPGAYPGIGAEQRGQSEAIAKCLKKLSGLRTPIIAMVIGEGGSGGALAIGLSDRLLMLEYATYSVISPEGCASILWKSAEKAADAANAMGVTTKALAEHGLVDRVINEPLGGAHRNIKETMQAVKTVLVDELELLSKQSVADCLENRYTRLMQYGRFEDVA